MIALALVAALVTTDSNPDAAAATAAAAQASKAWMIVGRKRPSLRLA
jgi:hypothetical protein